MRNTLKRGITIVVAFALFMVGLAVPSQDAQAADINKKAREAFAMALVQEKIKYGGKYCLCDINSDGVKELIVDLSGEFVIWKYANGKVSKLADIIEMHTLTYDKKSKTLWALGDGDGGWMRPYKLINGSFKETGTWYYITADGKKAEKVTKKGTKKINVKEYRKIQNYVLKNDIIETHRLKKTKLIPKLQNKEYTPQYFHLSTNLSKVKGIRIEKVTSKYIKYKKVSVQSVQSSGGGEYTGFYPYDNATYKLRYSKKIDVFFLLADINSGGWWKDTKFAKAYSGISYKKMKECFNKSHTIFAPVKNKKGEIIKLVELYEA